MTRIRLFIALLPVALALTACDGCSPPTADPPRCYVGGESYDVGEEIDDPTAPADCTGCECGDDGEVDCPAGGSCATTCLDQGAEHDVGDRWSRDNVRCTCTLAGFASCEALPCSPGTTQLGACGSECTCDNTGTWQCPNVACCAVVGGGPGGSSNIACAPTCFDGEGLVRFQGETWTEDGQLCVCDFNGGFCRDATCRYLDETYQPGTIFTLDGCGECTCNDDTTLTCEQPDCLPTCTEFDTNGTLTTRLAGERWSNAFSDCLCTAQGPRCCTDGQACDFSCVDDDGVTRAIDEVWQTPDGACTCTELLDVQCNDVCAWQGVGHQPGDVVPVGDGCTCTCGAGGSVTCAEAGCLPTSCTSGSSTVAIGEEFTTPEGCNLCVCSQDGEVYCTDRICNDLECEYAGVVYPNGGTFPSADGCNDCSCGSGGAVLCTQRGCPQQLSCFDEGQTRAVGEVFTKADGCERCLCSTDGQIYCTARCAGSIGYDAGPADGGATDAGDAGTLDAGLDGG
jgi:hypothetical protein